MSGEYLVYGAAGSGSVDAEPRLARLWATRFPFAEGWEG